MLLQLVLVVVLCWPGEQMLSLKVSFLTKTTSPLGVSLTPPPPPNSPWIISYIYGPPEKKNKAAFWDSLTAAGEDFVSPWLSIGDFNFVLDQFEKLGGYPVASSSHCPFKNLIDHHGLVDLGFVGNPYTWFNNRQGLAVIKERLDRALASLD